MADGWQTYPVEFVGGLVTNLSPLQQATRAPGSARILRNFEPSIEGGYKRIEGYTKYDDNIIPPYGEPVVHGGSQSGTTLVIGNIFKSPEAGDTFTIAGVSGTYTIDVGGVIYDSTNKRATLTLTTSLDSSPANAAVITFTSTVTNYLANGIKVWYNDAIAARNSNIFKSTGSGYTYISKPNYGTVLVDGGSQTGTTLDVDGLTGTPQVGDVFKINGVDLVYTITAAVTVASGSATLTINPALDSSPADDASVTFLGADREGATRVRFERYNFDGTRKLVTVDGLNIPAIYDGTDFVPIDDAPSEVVGAEFVLEFKNALFFAKGTLLSFTAPFSDTDFSAANGGGQINVKDDITGLISFREQLFIFTERSIQRLSGNTLADFVLQPVTMDIGCVVSDTIQEIGGDVMFLGPDGLRLLSGTERNNDFGLAVVSKNIQKNFTDFINRNTNFTACLVREKSQYRIFGYNDNITQENAQSVIATQFAPQGNDPFAFSEVRGIRAYVSDCEYVSQEEVILFANNDGYVYNMESGNSFDGDNIIATFSTPFFPINDPQIRKTFYKLNLYTEPQGSVSFDVSLKLNFDQLGVIQPDPIQIENTSSQVGFYGTASYGTGNYGNRLKTVFQTQLIGSGDNVSIQFNSTGTNPPFSLDALTLEYSNNGRR